MLKRIWLVYFVIFNSCVNPFPEKKGNNIMVDSTYESKTINNNISSENHEIESVDKFNVIVTNNLVTNATYNVSLSIPRNWKRFHGQAEHTILKIGNKKLGAQVSLIRMKEKYNNMNESELDMPLSDYISKIAESGLNLQNAKEIETTCLGYRAKRIDANYILYEGDLSIVENYIAISFIKDGALYTLSTTFPQMLSDQVMGDIDFVFNSIQFN